MRIGKVHPSPFHEGDSMTDWYHPVCFFDAMKRALAKTPVPMSPEDIKGWEDMRPEDEAMLQPLLDEFVSYRKAKLAGTLPKKPKAPKASPASPAPSTSPSISSSHGLVNSKHSSAPATDSPKKHSHTSSTSSPTNTATDKFGLKAMLDTRWYPILAPLIEALPGVEQMLSTFSPNFPNKARLFESLRGLDPSASKLIIIKDRPFLSASAASGFAFNNASDKTLSSANPQLSALLKAARSHSNVQGNLVDWETYSSRAPSAWFEVMKKQGVLFLHHELSVDPGNVNPSSAWDAVVLKIIKTVLSERQKTNAGGVVMALFGENFDQLKRSIQRIYNRFQESLPLRLIAFPLPDTATFSESAENPFETLDSFLLETENDPIDWFPSEPAVVVPEPPVKPSLSSYPPAPVLLGKITSRVQLTSMDGEPDLDVGKFHRDPSQKGTFLLRSVDIDPSDPTLSTHIGTFTMSDKATITFTPLSTNPIFYCPASATATAAAATPSVLQTGKPVKVRRGDLLSFSGDQHTYRIDPYNFSSPPTNRYHVESVNTSVADDVGDEAGLEPRLKDAKRPLDAVTKAVEVDEEELVKPPKAKKAKKTKAKHPAMDWMDDDEDENGMEDDMDPGDEEYKPPKNGVLPDDYIIDDGEDKDSDVDGEDEEAAFFADKRPLCMYGSSCYRTNPAHLAQFRHPPKPKS